ncbi:MAG TPA: tRNA (adenosine(37)-N6)-threonylcarbamoyltransferase complex ATPase subunit type 1 TsaE [Oscillospiraceae bacterium]|nr:tRNA (adenosine(37)-N6)-threonylcarbamoyltransferase complex ATPase subunit type 1 TsaE [Oscillospiraceae bacterium]
MELISKSVAQTEHYAQKLAWLLKSGDIVAFRGGLGVGKTAFVRGLARGLGMDDEVSSPTFSLVHEHRGKYTLYHFDMYRIQGEDDLYATGFYDYMDGDSILAIEWSENIEDSLPENAVVVTISVVDENTRKIVIEGDERFNEQADSWN